MPDSDIVRTGIAGLDDILLGGLPRGNVVIVTGSPGTGKTTFGVEFVYRGAHDFDEPGIIVTFEVSAEKLVRDAAQFGWDLRAPGLSTLSGAVGAPRLPRLTRRASAAYPGAAVP